MPGLGVALALGAVAVGVADGFGLAGAFLTEGAAIGLPVAMWGAKVAITALDSLRLSWPCWLWASGAADGALVTWAVSGIGTAPTPMATATATRATPRPAAVMTRKDAGGRAPRSLARTRS